jgi:hypothetical protein
VTWRSRPSETDTFRLTDVDRRRKRGQRPLGVGLRARRSRRRHDRGASQGTSQSGPGSVRCLMAPCPLLGLCPNRQQKPYRRALPMIFLTALARGVTRTTSGRGTRGTSMFDSSAE